MDVLHPMLCYIEVCYKGTALLLENLNLYPLNIDIGLGSKIYKK